MKRKYINKFGPILLAAMLIVAGCKKDGPFTVIKSNNSILINGSINNLTVPGGIAGGAGFVAPFDVVVQGSDVTSVTIANRYTLSGSSVIVEKTIGNYPVSGEKASIPAIPMTSLRNPTDPAITSTGNAGTNSFLIDVLMNNGTQERRIIAISLANSVIILDGDIYKINIPSSPSAGTPSITLTVNATVLGVRITSRYVLPDQSTPKNYTAGAVIYPTTAVDAVTRTVTIPAMTLAQLRDPADPQITGLSNVGQQFILIDALNGTLSTSTTLTTKTTNLIW